MLKTCKRCGCAFETEVPSRRYCDECREVSRREHLEAYRRLLESDADYRKTRIACVVTLKRRSRAFETRLLSKDEIDKLNADCERALIKLSEARRAAWAKWGKLPGKQVNKDLLRSVAQGLGKGVKA